jgi:dTMP kinase
LPRAFAILCVSAVDVVIIGAVTRGKFITFEGLDGCGKSTQLEKLAAVLRAEGHEVVTTREPGGTGIGEQVRAVLLNSRTLGLAPLAELALMFASRAQLLEEIVQPALAAGQHVLCDRYTDSSEAYQGAGRELGTNTVLAIHHIVCRNFWPDLTILMDSDPAASVERARRRNTQSRGARTAADENRFEQENRAFFNRVHQAYLAIAKREAKRVYTVDARRPIPVVHREIVTAVRERLSLAAAK